MSHFLSVKDTYVIKILFFANNFNSDKLHDAASVNVL